ncbi:type ISP restriction/modification enzyme [Streptacidiphilus sp. EB129]|uniref:type ISP restriction/modification enzyme n=1 Tax=Streptacidiphilus sp. EB129 TaxID=3156262 RepID=UPI003510DE2A
MAGAPLLSELMPWSVPGLRLGREWVRSAHPEVLAARWRRLTEASPGQRALLFGPSRSRTVHSAVAQLPGRTAATSRLARDPGPAPEPVLIRHGAFDRLWLLADQRLLDRARPELWRVADRAQLFATVQPWTPTAPGPAVTFSAELPDGHRTRGVGRIHPLYRQPGGQDPNLAPGLTEALAGVLGLPVTPPDVLAWIAAVTAHPAAARDGEEVPVPLPSTPEQWTAGLALGRRVLWLHSFGARCADPAGDRPPGPPKMPSGRRPFVRERVSGFPDTLGHEPDGEALLLGADGRIAPVPASVTRYPAGGGPVLEQWLADRSPSADARPGSLESLGLATWPQQFTADLIQLATVLALLAELHPAQSALAAPDAGRWLSGAELAEAGVLPVPPQSRRPASVLQHQEEGPEGQFALL